jgi:hypothetical protein
MGRLKRILTFEGVKGRGEAKYLEILKKGIVTSDHRRINSTERDTLFSSCRSFQGKIRTIRILCGEIAKSREPSNLTED